LEVFIVVAWSFVSGHFFGEDRGAAYLQTDLNHSFADPTPKLCKSIGMVFRMAILIFFITIGFFSSSWSYASQGLSCRSTDGFLKINYKYIEGDGLNTLLGDFLIEFKDKKSKPGLFNWFKMNNSEFSLTVFSWLGRQVRIQGRKNNLPPYSFQIINGFIKVDETEIDLTGLEISCEEG
jgi:hypothetical protein